MNEDVKDDPAAVLLSLLVSVQKSSDNLFTTLKARPETELTSDLIKQNEVNRCV